FTNLTKSWGTDGIAISLRGSVTAFILLHAAGFLPVPPGPLPTPSTDSLGITHLPFRANGVVFDAKHNLVWASVPGSVPEIGNSVISIDPATGRIVDVI